MHISPGSYQKYSFLIRSCFSYLWKHRETCLIRMEIIKTISIIQIIFLKGNLLYFTIGGKIQFNLAGYLCTSSSSQKCLLKRSYLNTYNGLHLKTNNSVNIEQCVNFCEVRQKLLRKENYCWVIQETPECTAFLFWESRCYLYKYGEFRYPATSPFNYISGLCPKAVEIEEHWQSDGFYCDMTGISGIRDIMHLSH